MVVPRLTAAVHASQEWQARHEACAQQLQRSQGARTALQETVDAQTAEVQQLGSLLAAKQKEVQRVRFRAGSSSAVVRWPPWYSHEPGSVVQPSVSVLT